MVRRILVATDDIGAGTRGRSELPGPLLGSTAYRTLDLAHCPGLVVP